MLDWEDLVNNVDLEKGMDVVAKHSRLLFELLSKYRPINNLIFKHFPYTYIQNVFNILKNNLITLFMQL